MVPGQVALGHFLTQDSQTQIVSSEFEVEFMKCCILHLWCEAQAGRLSIGKHA